MTTLISVHNRGRCDGKCHNAKHENCVCVCDGVNHGVGRSQAIENTRQMTDRLCEKFHEVEFGREVVQLELF